MSSVLHPVGDGAALGDIQIVGSDGVERFVVLTPALGDEDHISIVAEQGHGFDVKLQTRGPIALGDGALRGRFARLAGNGGVELAASLWRQDPRKAVNSDAVIARTANFQVWHDEWDERSMPIIGRDCDQVAAYMGDLWIRIAVVSAIDGTDIPTLGVAALWLEVPDASEAIAFQDPTTSPPPDSTLVTIRTFSGRTATAKNVSGEWLDASNQPFEADKHSLPLGSDGKPQESRAVNGWGQ